MKIKIAVLFFSLTAIAFCAELPTPKLLQAEGSPESVLYANTGDLCTGKTGAQLYVKTGGYSNTGWVQVVASGAPTPVGYVTGAGGAVTQATSSSTGVTLNKPVGQVTTVALTTAAGANEVFTVTDSTCAATDIPVVSTTYAGAGTIRVSTKKVAAGAFDVVISNVHASAALNAAAVVNFAIVKGVAQ